MRSRDPPNDFVSKHETDAGPPILKVGSVPISAFDRDDDVVLVAGTEPAVREQFADLLTKFLIVEIGIPDAGGTLRRCDVLAAFWTDYGAVGIPGWRPDNWGRNNIEPTES